ncbi:MAG: LamG domain-containing protein [Pirellulales bacterium]|nr:LamG domain-containing protein [Pirellulales bacterium]
MSENGNSETYVFIGKVLVVAVNGQETDGQSKVIQSGQFARVKANEPLFVREKRSEEVAARFTRAMPERLSTADAYAELMHSLNPTAYYRMERLPKDAATSCYVLADSTSGAYHGVLHVDRAFDSPSWRGKYGGALNLHGLGAGEYAIVPDYPNLSGDRLSASAWVWDVGHQSDAYATILSKRLLPSPSRNVASMFFGISYSRELYVGLVQESGEQVSVIEHGMEFPRGRWEHVAFVADGEVLRLYRNGVEVGSSPYRGIIHHSFSARGLSIGCVLDTDHVKPDSERSGFWDGRIDELAVFHHALGAEQVWRLYGGSANAARPSVGNGKEPVGRRERAADPFGGKDTDMGSGDNRKEVEANNSPGTSNREVVR